MMLADVEKSGTPEIRLNPVIVFLDTGNVLNNPACNRGLPKVQGKVHNRFDTVLSHQERDDREPEFTWSTMIGS